MDARPTFSLIIPVFNEEAVLPVLLPRLDALLPRLGGSVEVIFVDDGSRDLSSFILEQRARTDPRFKFVGLSRNFGHQIAVTTGLDLARGDAVVVLDADLQDPPELVLDLAAKWREGFDIVSARRRSRAGESRFKRATAHLFYRIVNRIASIDIPQDVGDFRLIDRKVVDAFCSLRERERFVRGLFAWVGFKHAIVEFERDPRAAGVTKYPLRKMLSLAVNGIISFSEAPLRAALWCGMAVSALALLYGLYVLGLWATSPHLVRGWTSTVVIAAFLGGANMFMTGIMGLYVGRIYAEVKARPLYLIDRSIGFEVASAGHNHRNVPAALGDAAVQPQSAVRMAG
jgi:polyisoprenyl-phosphate glycosyltransferase